MHHHPSQKYIHHLICQHQIEVEIWPPSAEVYFEDERYSDPANSQIRFDATVYNASTDRVIWSVQNLNGEQGAGSIDSTGLYVAPHKGSFVHGTTDLIVASSSEDRFRRAYAFVTLIGAGPEPKPAAKVEIYPKVTELYFPRTKNFIDESNTKQVFHALVKNHVNQNVVWTATSNPNISSPFTLMPDINTPTCLLSLNTSSDSFNWIEIKAALTDDATIFDEAKVVPIHYYWPHYIV
jgi:hypothetical protein